jgi:pimeloyl-ACP methyl ester carboxylesterase
MIANSLPSTMVAIRRSFPLALLLSAMAGCTQTNERFADVEVGGHRLHLLIVGDAHPNPSVVLESGAGGGVGWIHVRNRIAQFAQVITYDRAGIGDSQPGPEPRDARTIAGEVHAALRQAGVPPPYLLVGESLGGIYVQVFAAMFPAETAGLVLVDPTHASADLCLSTDQVKAWFMTHDADDWPHVETYCRGAPDGLRSFLACKYKVMETFIESVPEPRRSAMRSEWWAMVDKIVGKSVPWKITGGAREEEKVMADSIRQAIAARPLPKVPVMLLAAGKTDLDSLPPDASTPNVLALQAEARRWNMAAFREWVDQTPGAKLVVVQGSGHGIASERPGAVIDAVREALRRVEEH